MQNLRFVTPRISARFVALPVVILGLTSSLAGADAQGKMASTEEAEEPSDQEEAKRLYKIGRLHYDGGEYNEAAETFVEAFELDPDAILAYNAARAWERAEDLANARDWYQKVLSLEPGPEVKERVDQALAQIGRVEAKRAEEAEAKKATTGKLVVSIDNSAEVSIDGDLVGVAPGSFDLEPGEHQIEVKRANTNVWRKTVTITPGEATEVQPLLIEVETSTTLPWVGFSLMVTGVGLSAAAFQLSDGEDLSSGGVALLVGAAVVEVAGAVLVGWTLGSEQRRPDEAATRWQVAPAVDLHGVSHPRW